MKIVLLFPLLSVFAALVLAHKIDFRHLQRLDNGKIGMSPPTWPLAWNATQLKITNETNPTSPQFTKFYYDWNASPGGSCRFDFYPNYLPTDLKWAPNFTILFTNNQVYRIYPLTRTCTIRSCALGSITPWWLKDTTYQGTYMFRGAPADLFMFGPEMDSVQYWQRHATQDTVAIPMRSTNMADDPGAADYVDVILGPQNRDLFKIPSYCPPCKTK